MGDMTVDELKDKKLWFLWSAKPGRNGKVTKVPFAANGGATGTDDAHKGTWVPFDAAESARNQFQASDCIQKGRASCPAFSDFWISTCRHWTE